MTITQSDDRPRALHIQNPEILCYDDSYWVGTATISWSMAIVPSYSVSPVILAYLVF